MLKLGEKKLSKEQRSRLFHSLVRPVVPEGMDMRKVTIELYVMAEAESLRVPRDGGIGEQRRELGVVTMPLLV